MSEPSYSQLSPGQTDEEQIVELGFVEDAQDIAEDPDEEAPLQMSPGKDYTDEEMDITPMIDITFLLLIFFLVASKMDEQAAVKLPKAAGDPAATRNAVVLIINKVGPDEVTVKKEDGQLFSSDAATQADEIKAYIEEGINSGEKKLVMIKGEKGIKYKEISRVAKAVSKAEPADVETVKTLFLAVESQ